MLASIIEVVGGDVVLMKVTQRPIHLDVQGVKELWNGDDW